MLIMKRMHVTLISFFVLLRIPLDAIEISADDVISQSGIKQGLVVILPHSNGQLETELAKTGSFLVESLSLQPAQVFSQRKRLADQGVFPLANVQAWLEHSALPYAPNLINLLVVDLDALPGTTLSEKDIRSVLAYTGKAIIRENGSWRVLDNPFPEQLDEWGHALRGPDRRPVSTDRGIQPHMSGLKWMADTYERIGQNATGMRIADGKIYFMIKYTRGWVTNDQGKRTYDRKARFRVIARDAYNGLFLWQHDLDWMPVYKGNHGREDSMEFSHHWAAGNNRLYLYPKAGSYLTALDGDSGEVVRIYDQGAKLEAGEGQIPGYFTRKPGTSPFADPDRFMRSSVIVLGDKLVQGYGREIFVFDQATGKRLARYQHALPLNGVLVGEDGHVYAVSQEDVISLTADTLRPRWTRPLPTPGSLHAWTGPLKDTLLVHIRGGKHGLENKGFYSINTSNGEIRWQTTRVRNHSIILKDRVTTDGWAGSSDYDILTGEKMDGHGIDGDMAGCSYPTYTPEFIIRGLTLHSREDPRKAWAADGSRPDCQIPTYPANGHLYLFGAKCGCSNFMRSGLSAYYPLPEFKELSEAQRMRTESTRALPTACPDLQVNSPFISDWRRGMTFAIGHKGFDWKAVPGATATAQSKTFQNSFYNPKDPVRKAEASGTTVRAVFNRNLLEAVNNQEVTWSLPLGGRVITDPVIANGTVYVGVCDGQVHAVDLESGTLRWSYLAAPMERRMMAVGQVESAWPITGLTIDEGQLLIAAGRRDSYDDGIFIRCLDLDKGILAWSERIQRTRMFFEEHKPRLRAGFNGFGAKLTTHAGPFIANENDTAFYLYGRSPVSPQLRREPPKPAKLSASDLKPGLHYSYYEFGERQKRMVRLEEQASAFSGTTENVVAKMEAHPKSMGKTRDTSYAFQFNGYLKVAEDGQYRLELGTNGAVELELDGKRIISGGNQPVTPMIPLTAGFYPLKLSFVSTDVHGGSLWFSWQKDGGRLQPVSETDLFHRP